MCFGCGNWTGERCHFGGLVPLLCRLSSASHALGKILLVSPYNLGGLGVWGWVGGAIGARKLLHLLRNSYTNGHFLACVRIWHFESTFTDFGGPLAEPPKRGIDEHPDCRLASRLRK